MNQRELFYRAVRKVLAEKDVRDILTERWYKDILLLTRTVLWEGFETAQKEQHAKETLRLAALCHETCWKHPIDLKNSKEIMLAGNGVLLKAGTTLTIADVFSSVWEMWHTALNLHCYEAHADDSIFKMLWDMQKYLLIVEKQRLWHI